MRYSDPFGVDLRSGQISARSEVVGIGLKDSPSVSYAPFEFNVNDSQATPRLVYLERYVCGGADGCDEFYVAGLGGSEISFPLSSQGSTVALTGETLVTNLPDEYVIYDKNGTKWEFTKKASGNQGIYEIGVVTRITYADGRALDYERGTDGSLLIRSSDGYAVYTSPSSGAYKATLVNLANEYCGLGNCAVTQSWPHIDSVVGANQSSVYTDALGRATSIQTTLSGGGSNNVISRPSGLIEQINRQPVTIWTNGNSQVQQMRVVSYSSQLGSAAYSYSGGPSGDISLATSSRATGAVVKYEPGTLTDEIGRKTYYTFDTVPMYGWSSADVETHLHSVTYPENASEQWTYDIHGNVISSTATAKPASGMAALQSTTSYSTTCSDYKSCYRPNYRVDARGARTDYSYDPASGLVQKITEPADIHGVRPETRFTYVQLQASYIQSAGGAAIPSGKPIWKLQQKSICRTLAATNCIGTVDEVRTSYTYDGNLLPISETISTGDGAILSTVTRAYDSVGNIIWEDGPLAGTADRKYFFWDAGRQMIGTIVPAAAGNLATRTTYNGGGSPTLIQNGTATDVTRAALDAMTPMEEHSFTYDSAGRKIREDLRAYGGMTYAVTQYSYNAENRLDCTAVRMNMDLFNTTVPGPLPADACTPGGEGSQGPDRITRVLYDAAGQVLQSRKGVGSNVEQADATYSYTPDGKMEYMIDADGNRAKFEYDGFDRQARWTLPSSTRPAAFNAASPATALSTAGVIDASDYEEYGYDQNGNRTSWKRRNGSTFGYSYDALNRVVVKSVPDCTSAAECQILPASATRDVYYDYDLRGLLTVAAFDSLPSGTACAGSTDCIANSYNGLGLATDSTTVMGGISRELSYAYDARGNRASIGHPDGNSVSYSYDPLDRMQSAYMSGTVKLADYSYDLLGRRHSITQLGAAGTVYGYDPVSRPLSASHVFNNNAANMTATVGYNPASQIVSLTRTNDAYAYHEYASASKSYNANGLNQYTDVSGGGLSYDSNGNLNSDGGTVYVYDRENRLLSATGTRNIAMTYDPLGRLFQTVGQSGTRQFLYDGDKLTVEYDGAGTVLRRHAFGPGDDEPIVTVEGSVVTTAAMEFLHQDNQGSVIGIANDSGNLSAINSYDEYGVPAGTNIGTFQYTGQMWIPDLGMYYYKARIYSSKLGRFLQTDPVGYDDQSNLYAYVGNDPINMTDPSGMENKCSNAQGVNNCDKDSPVQQDIIVTGRRPRKVPPPKPDVTSSPSVSAPQNPHGDDIVVTAQKYGKKILQCAADHYGLGALGIGGVASGANILATRGKFAGATPGTSLASRAASAVFGKAKLPFRIPTLTGFPLVGEGMAVRFTSSAARVAGRGVPVLGWALVAYDVGSIALCTASSE